MNFILENNIEKRLSSYEALNLIWFKNFMEEVYILILNTMIFYIYSEKINFSIFRA